MLTPGSYYIDCESALLYVYPECDIASADIEISVMDEPFIAIENAHDVVIDGFSFRLSKSNAIVFNGDNITIKNCTFSCIFDTVIDGEGLHNTVSECEIAHVGKGGIKMRAGDKPTLSPGYALVDNCLDTFRKFRVPLTYRSIWFSISGVDARQQMVHCHAQSKDI